MESQQYHNHMASENLFLFQSNCVVKLLLLNIAFLLFPLFSRKVIQDDPNVTVWRGAAARSRPLPAELSVAGRDPREPGRGRTALGEPRGQRGRSRPSAPAGPARPRRR